MPSPSGRLDTTWSGGVGSVDYGRIPTKPMGEYPISNCKMTGGRRRTGRKNRRTKRSRKHNKSRKAPRK
jgi:hypothetical protein